MRGALVVSLAIHTVALAWLPWTSTEKPRPPAVRFASATLEPATHPEPRLVDPVEPQPDPVLPAETFEEPAPRSESEELLPRLEPRPRLPRNIRVSARYKVHKRRVPVPPIPHDPPPPSVAATPSAPTATPTPPKIRADRQVPPRYPSLARRRAWEGTTILELRISASGTVESVALKESSGYALLDREAMRVAREWRYRPATRAGRPVAATLLQPIEFRLR